MSHRFEKYVGLPYVEGEFDCGELARLVQRECFGREIALPSERPYMDKIGIVDKFHAMSAQINAEKDNFAERTESPQEGDGVLLHSRGYLQHIGLYCVIQGEPYVLHAADLRVGPQVVLQKVRDLPMRGLKIEGFYKWI